MTDQIPISQYEPAAENITIKLHSTFLKYSPYVWRAIGIIVLTGYICFMAGLFHDIAMMGGPCFGINDDTRTSLSDCAIATLLTIGFYLINLLMLGLQYGPYVAFLFWSISLIKYDKIKWSIYLIIGLVLVPLPALLNSFQGWLWLKMTGDDASLCLIANSRNFFSMKCAERGMIVGAIMIAFTIILVVAIKLGRRCYDRQESRRMQADLERAKLFINADASPNDQNII
jgi:hypothetical protein